MSILGKILLVDDDVVFTTTLTRFLGRHGLEASAASDSQQALLLASQHLPHYAVLDLRLENESGMKLIDPLLQIQPDMKIIVLTGYASLATAVQAIKLGAIDYLAKPFDADTILQAFGLLGDEQIPVPIPKESASLKRLEWEHIQRALSDNNGNISATAKQLGMYRRTLQRKLQKKPSSW